MSVSTPAPAHDEELAQFLHGVTELAALRKTMGPDEFLSASDGLAAQFSTLQAQRAAHALEQHLEAFVRHRFELVDEASEYSCAGEETMVLSLALRQSPGLVIPALKAGVVGLSHALAEPEVLPLFSGFLRQLKALAQQTDNPELRDWVQQVVASLPE
jgi:hypothetical protein